MLLIKCPYCEEERPELEFRNAGEAHLVRASSITEQSDEDFAAFLYFRQNPKGLQFERWRHIHGCGRFFNAVRDSVSDKFLTVYKAGEPRPDMQPQLSPAPAELPATKRSTRTKKVEV
jgi:sarcosine oxidase subunit delta